MNWELALNKVTLRCNKASLMDLTTRGRNECYPQLIANCKYSF